MRMMSIASGSSGNCIYIGTNNTHILIDDGVSRKNVLEGLRKLDLSLEDIDAVCITHEHDDHIKGIGVLERTLEIPLYGTKGTLQRIDRSTKLGDIPGGIYNYFKAGDEFNINDIHISTIPVSHDAADPVAYVASDGVKKAAVITDLGIYNESIIEKLKNINSVLIESNHDIKMLMAGPYPYPLKQRILGERGHLSNEACGRLLGEILNDNTNHILLGHLSKENNFPELAFETVRLEVNLGDNGFNAGDFDIKVAGRDKPSDIIEV